MTDGVTLIIRPDLGRRPYRLKCAVVTNAFPEPAEVEAAKQLFGAMFVKDMAKQGWEWMSKRGLSLDVAHPQPVTEMVNLPSRHEQARWHTPSREMLAGALTGKGLRKDPTDYYVKRTNTLTELAEAERWEFHMTGWFVHKTILTETPSEAEEAKILRNR